MKSAFAFANWNIVIGFCLSWGVWELLVITAFAWGWLTIDDSFSITLIFTFVSYMRVYFMNKKQIKLRGNQHD